MKKINIWRNDRGLHVKNPKTTILSDEEIVALYMNEKYGVHHDYRCVMNNIYLDDFISFDCFDSESNYIGGHVINRSYYNNLYVNRVS